MQKNVDIMQMLSKAQDEYDKVTSFIHRMRACSSHCMAFSLNWWRSSEAPSSLLSEQVSMMWFIVCNFPHSHLCRFAVHRLYPVWKRFNTVYCCIGVLYGISNCLLQSLQFVQDAAARMATQTRKFDRIMPVLRELRWLPVSQRVISKLRTVSFIAQSSLASLYLSEIFCLTAKRTCHSHLSSALASTLMVLQTWTKYGDH